MQIAGDGFLSTQTAQQTSLNLRIRLLQVVLIVLIVASFIFSIALSITGDSLIVDENIIAPLTTLFAVGLYFIISRRQFIDFISFGTTSYLVVIGVVMFYVGGGDQNIGFLFIPFSLAALMSALTNSRLSFVFFNFVMGAVVVFTTVLLVVTDSGANNDLNFALGLIVFALGLVPLSIGIAARYFVSQLETIATQSQRSARLLSASADIGRSVSEMLDLEALLTRAAEIIRDRFAYYHVSIFLVDSNQQYANLTASTGEIGEKMLARAHRLPIDTESVVGRSAQALDIIVTRNAERDSRQAFNELLPDTRSEIGIPIVDNDGVVGVVDIQSRLPDAFTPTEIAALRVIANQLATAIRNARLFEDKERSIRENKRLFIEAETNLREIQRLNRQLTKDAWSDYLRGGRRVDGVTLTDEAFKNSASWTDEMLEASQKRRPLQVSEDGKQRIAVPIELRGEVVGAIELETNERRSDDDIMDMVRSISQRLAVTLDNARLFEESNMATAQEQQISEIVSQYQAADSVDDLLRLTLEGLSETLGADNASIRLGALDELTDVIDEFSDTEPDRATIFFPSENQDTEMPNGNGDGDDGSDGNGGQSV